MALKKPATNNLPGKPMGLTDWAYERIKAALLNLDFPPGSQLQVEKLSQQMGISRTPVREALLRLEKDGLVQVLPRVGFFATEFSPSDLEDLYELRELLESRAVRDAVLRLTEGEIDELHRVVEMSAAAIANEDVNGFLKAEIAFHAFLTDHSHNRRLIATVESFRDLTYRWRKLSIKSLDDVRISVEEHEKIVDAIQNKDAELASRLMAEHICRAKDRILQIVHKYQETGTLN